MWWPSVSDAVSSGSTLGVFLLATIIAAILYGITVLQNIQYVDRHHNDPASTKFLVVVLWLFETTTMVLEVHALYIYAVAHSGTQFAAVTIPQTILIERAFSYATVFTVQMFFAARIREGLYTVGSGIWLLPILTGLFATGGIVLGLTATVKASQFVANDPLRPAFVDILSTTSAGLQIGTDVAIVGSLYWLFRNRAGDLKKPALKHTLLSAVNRGVFSVVLQVLTTATYFALRPRMVWIAFHMASSKVHALSLLSTLNARTLLEGEGYDTEIADARLRRRLARELGPLGERLPSQPPRDGPPTIPSIAHGLGLHVHSSQISWFGDKSDGGGMGSYSPSYHARSTTAVEGTSGMSNGALLSDGALLHNHSSDGCRL